MKYDNLVEIWNKLHPIMELNIPYDMTENKFINSIPFQEELPKIFILVSTN